MKIKESPRVRETSPTSTGGLGGDFVPIKPLVKKEGGLVSQIASKFQNSDTSSPRSTAVSLKKTSDCVLIKPSTKDSTVSAVAIKKNSVNSVVRTENHQALFNSARAMFEKLGSNDDLESISSPPGIRYNRGPSSSRGSSVQRSRSTSPPVSSRLNSQPPKTPEILPESSHSSSDGFTNGHGITKSTDF